MSLMKSDRTKAPKSDRIAGYAITRTGVMKHPKSYACTHEGHMGAI